jgi:hypothetical protein
MVGWGVMGNYEEAKDETQGKDVDLKSGLYVDKCSNSVLQWAVLPLPMNTSWRQPPPSDQYTILKGVDAS